MFSQEVFVHTMFLFGLHLEQYAIDQLVKKKKKKDNISLVLCSASLSFPLPDLL